MAKGKKKVQTGHIEKERSSDGFMNKKISRREALSTGGKIAIGAAAVIVAGGAIAAAYELARNGSTNTTTVTVGNTSSSSGGTTSSPANTANGIPIGFVAALTGSGYGEGQPMLIGARIAQDFINNPSLVSNPTGSASTTTTSSGGVLGKPLNLIISDEQSDPQTGLTVVQRMIQENGVVGLTGENYSFVTLGYIDYVHQVGIPFVNSGSNSSVLRQKKYPNVFFIETASCAGATPAYSLIEQLYKGGMIHNVAIIYSSDELGVLVENTIESNLKSAGVPFTSSEVPLTQNDFTSILLGFKNANPRPDMLVVGITGAGALVIPGQAASTGFAPTTETPWCFEPGAQFPNTENVWKAVGPNLLGWLSSLNWPPPSALKLTSLGEAVNAYCQKQYGIPGIEGIYDGFDGVWSLVSAINTAGSTDASAIVTALQAQNIQGSRSQLHYPSSGPDVGTDDCSFQNVPAEAVVCQFTKPNQQSTDPDFPVVFPANLANGTIQSTMAIVQSNPAPESTSTST